MLISYEYLLNATKCYIHFLTYFILFVNGVLGIFSINVEVKVSPDEATIKDVYYKSMDESIAVVDSNGVVTAISKGNVSIKVGTLDGTIVSAFCSVNVTDESLEINPTEVPDEDVLPGDVNFDGNVDATDALTVLKHAAKLDILKDENQLIAADVELDNNIDASDALAILKIAAKLI